MVFDSVQDKKSQKGVALMHHRVLGQAAHRCLLRARGTSCAPVLPNATSPGSGYHRKEPGSILSHPSFQVFVGMSENCVPALLVRCCLNLPAGVSSPALATCHGVAGGAWGGSSAGRRAPAVSAWAGTGNLWKELGGLKVSQLSSQSRVAVEEGCSLCRKVWHLTKE